MTGEPIPAFPTPPSRRLSLWRAFRPGLIAFGLGLWGHFWWPAYLIQVGFLAYLVVRLIRQAREIHAETKAFRTDVEETIARVDLAIGATDDEEELRHLFVLRGHLDDLRLVLTPKRKRGR